MKSAGDGGGAGEKDAGDENAVAAVVIVGVRPDERSREVLTWALVNVARPGDRIVALHVLDTVVEGSASLISLVRIFDTMLGVYESFCNLKQVDLKLKVCKGKSARRTLVQEAKSYGAASLIVGSSRKYHTIRSSTSIAKHCARHLPKDVSVFAVDGGKIMFRRVPGVAGNDDSRMNLPYLACRSSSNYIEASKVTDEMSPDSRSVSAIASSRCLMASCSSSSQVPENLGEDNSLALVPVQTSENDSGQNSTSAASSLQSKPGWPFLRRLYLCKRKSSSKPSAMMSLRQWVSRLRGRHSGSVIHPDKKRRHAVYDEDCSSTFDDGDVSVVSFSSEAVHPPLSPHSGLSNIPKELEGLPEKYASTCRLFTYDELLSTTSNFSPKNMIGEGGSSYVYRGCLSDGKELAIKILKPSVDVVKEFMLEIEVITSLHHKNIISLFGFSFENNNLTLVYDYLPRGSLEENLHGNRKDEATFCWKERYKVAIGIAEALDYLHNRHEPTVIHRDVKSSNVLLSDDFEPQLSDFGFASLAANASMPTTCMDVAGTFGYLAPEYFMHGKVTEKIDVYAFGVVLLELISGRKPICSDYPRGQESLVMWAKPILESGKFSQLLDASLSSNDNDDLIERMVLAATLCIRRTPRARPQIGLVLKLLQGDEEATNWAKQQVEVSEEAACPTNIQSHINLALLDLEDESVSDGSPDHSISVEEYLKGRQSRTPSFQLN